MSDLRSIMHSPLCAPSTEQATIIAAIKDSNVIVDAVAGSGKTTTSLHIATTYPKWNILLLTYNARLKEETRQRVLDLGITNMEVHSYHAFCVKYYDRTCFTDTQIIKMLKSTTCPQQQIPSYDLIILDEAQDMTPVYYELSLRILQDVHPLRMMVLGDWRQSIFKFNHADERFIKFADKLFGSSSTGFEHVSWVRYPLSTTFRCSQAICDFINMCIGTEALVSGVKPTSTTSKTRPSVIYTIKSPFKALHTVLDVLEHYDPEDIFVLAPSVKSMRSPIRTVANSIKEQFPDILVHVPTSDEEVVDKDVLKGKLCFTTFHQVKGLERKAVVILGFDTSYFNFYNRTGDRSRCSNELYVAMSRAKEHLVLVQGDREVPFHFLNIDRLSQVCDVRGRLRPPHNAHTGFSENKVKDITVTDMTKHIPAHVIEHALSFLEVVKSPCIDQTINVPIKIKQGSTFESVSEISGIAITSHFEYTQTERMTIDSYLSAENKPQFSFVYDSSDETMQNSKEKISGVPDEVKNKKHDVVWNLLDKATRYCSFASGYTFKTQQIKRYDWMTIEQLEACTKRLDSLLNGHVCLFEEACFKNVMNFTIVGRIDCVSLSNNTIYEFKCVKELKDEHLLQLAIYAFLYLRLPKMDPDRPSLYDSSLYEQISVSGPRRYILFNILSNEQIEVKADESDLTNMIEYLIDERTNKSQSELDSSFLEKCKTIRDRVKY